MTLLIDLLFIFVEIFLTLYGCVDSLEDLCHAKSLAMINF